MDTLFRALRALPRGKQIAVLFMILLIVLTWLAVCLIMASYLN